MKLDKKQKTQYTVLGVVVVAVLIWRFSGSGDKKAKPSPAKNVQAAVSQITDPGNKENAGTAEKTVEANVVKIRFDDWGRDPFKDPTIEKKEVQAVRWRDENFKKNLSVKGILRNGGVAHVMINDMILAEGEEKDGLYVDRIEGNDIYCRKSGKAFTLTWKETP